MDLVAGFAGGSALPSVVAFVDDGVVEDVAAKREVEVVNGPFLDRGWF